MNAPERSRYFESRRMRLSILLLLFKSEISRPYPFSENRRGAGFVPSLLELRAFISTGMEKLKLKKGPIAWSQQTQASCQLEQIPLVRAETIRSIAVGTHQLYQPDR